MTGCCDAGRLATSTTSATPSSGASAASVPSSFQTIAREHPAALPLATAGAFRLCVRSELNSFQNLVPTGKRHVAVVGRVDSGARREVASSVASSGRRTTADTAARTVGSRGSISPERTSR